MKQVSQLESVVFDFHSLFSYIFSLFLMPSLSHFLYRSCVGVAIGSLWRWGSWSSLRAERGCALSHWLPPVQRWATVSSPYLTTARTAHPSAPAPTRWTTTWHTRGAAVSTGAKHPHTHTHTYTYMHTYVDPRIKISVASVNKQYIFNLTVIRCSDFISYTNGHKCTFKQSS